MELGCGCGGGVAMGGTGQPGGAGRGHEMTGGGGGVDYDEQVGGNITEPSRTIQMGELDQQPVGGGAGSTTSARCKQHAGSPGFRFRTGRQAHCDAA